MILQALNQYYERMGMLGNALAPEGWIDRPIDYVFKLDSDGVCLGVIGPQGNGTRKKPRGALHRVPNVGKQALKHTNSGDDANLLWDNSSFVLGVGAKGEKKKASFRAAIDRYFGNSEDAGLQAVRRFLSKVTATAESLNSFLSNFPEHKEDICSGQPTVSFQLVDDPVDLVCQRAAVRSIYEKSGKESENGQIRQCLVSGNFEVVEIAHPVIKGIRNGQVSGGTIVSFNERAYESYGKEKQQGLNAPVGRRAAFAYTTALNYLLREGSRQRLQVGDATTVFWTQEPDSIEDTFSKFFSDDSPNHTEELRAALESIKSGNFDGANSGNLFYVLGLAPNEARISVRFWHATPVRDTAHRIRDWFSDIRVARGPHDPEFPSLFRLLTACAVQGKADNIPPNLGGDIMRAILSGSPFPTSWLNAVVQRSRAERDVTYLRAAAIKASLNRACRNQLDHTELQPMLDVNNMNVAYRLGRLFATLEKVQEEASPGLNATIRDRYYGAASSTPVAVFTTLLRLKNHHLGKIENRGRVANLEKLFGEILGCIKDFPAHLTLPDQGRFALGYYHQRRSFFTKSE